MGRAALYKDNSFNSEVEGFNVMRVRIIPMARIIGAPVETGTTSFDNKVNDPAKVIVTGTVVIGSTNAESAMAAIDEMMYNREFEFYSVCDGELCIANLIMESSPSTRDPEKYDFITYELMFRSAILVSGENEGGEGEHSDTQANGYQSGSST